MKTWFVLFVLALGSVPGLNAAEIAYTDGTTPLKGYLAGEKFTGKRPGVLIIHQWMGLTRHEMDAADRIAKDWGYVAFAADIYGPTRPASIQDAATQAAQFRNDRSLYRSRLTAALEQLQARPNVDPRRLAVIGYCFGGMGALELARMNAPVLGAVSFHGSFAKSDLFADPERMAPKILILHGADDPYSDRASVAALQKELDAAHADYEVVLYSGTVHAFTQKEAGDDPAKGAAYNAESDVRSWRACGDFLKELFR